jgi:hypothetical protein
MIAKEALSVFSSLPLDHMTTQHFVVLSVSGSLGAFAAFLS